MSGLFKIVARRFLDILKILVTGRIFFESNELKRKIRKAEGSFKTRGECVKGEELVSVVVPTKNEAFHLPSLLTSLKLATYKPIEVVVVDYSSTDGTVEIAKNFDARVSVVDKKGCGYASHIGVLESRGDIIIRTDADAVFPPDTILDAVKVFRRNKRVKLYHIGHLYRDGALPLNLMAHVYDKYWREKWKTSGHFMAFTKDIYEAVGGFDVNRTVGEDFAFGQKVSKKFLIAYNPSKVVLVSSRRNRGTGFLNYILGRRLR